MNLVSAFLRLIRWPNLVFIALTQLLFYFCIYLPLYNNHQIAKLSLLIVASVFIAAAGYIINDYFDLNIDQVNKPRRAQKAVWPVLDKKAILIFRLDIAAHLPLGFEKRYVNTLLF